MEIVYNSYLIEIIMENSGMFIKDVGVTYLSS